MKRGRINCGRTSVCVSALLVMCWSVSAQTNVNPVFPETNAVSSASVETNVLHAAASQTNAVPAVSATAVEPFEAAPDVNAWWRMDATSRVAIIGAAIRSETNPAFAGGIAFSSGGGRVNHSREVPGAFIYDPLTMRSHTNVASLHLADDGKAGACIEVPFTPVFGVRGSFTMELFLRARADQKLEPGESIPIVAKSRVSDKTGAFEIRIAKSGFPRAQSWIEACVTAPDGKPQTLARNRFGRSTHVSDGKTWRHVAMVYDAAAKRARFYCDYELIAETPHTTQLEPLDRGPLVIGGRAGGRGISGNVDEARYTGRALSPWEFLRTSQVNLQGVSFQPVTNSLVPPESGCVDVRLLYGAVGDGMTDDTKAIQRAFKECADRMPDSYSTVYFPAGVYVVSATCKWPRFMTVQGDGTNRTVIKLRNNCPGFDNSRKPRPVLAAGNWAGGEGSGSAYANYVFDLAVETGSGNTGAIGIEFHANNEGGIENVAVRSGDGAGVAGIDFSRPWPGPSFQKSVRVDGFDTGIRVTQREFGLVFENITLVGQKEAGLRNEGNSLAVKGLRSFNAGAGLINAQAAGFVVLLDSEFYGTGDDSCAIVNKGGMFARSIMTTGCVTAIKSRERTVPGPMVREFVSGEVVAQFGSVPMSLHMPVAQTPALQCDDSRDWVNVTAFAGRVKEGDWSDAVQAAIDSGGTTIFFPAEFRCEIKKPVHVRGKVRRITGFRSGMYGSSGIFTNMPMLVFDGPGTNAVVLDRLALQTDFGKRVTAVLHTNRQPLVISRCNIAGYEGGPDSGPLFLEDISAGCWRFHPGQRVSAKQLNIEYRKQEVKIVNTGAQLWILGLRSGSAGTVLLNRAGAHTEILGGLINPDEDAEQGIPMFRNEDSSLSVSIAESCYFRNYETLVEDLRGTEKKELALVDADWSGGRAKINLYTSTTNTPRRISLSPP